MDELNIEAVWYDENLCEMFVEATNVFFTGKVKTTAFTDYLSTFVEDLENFPRSISDTVTFSTGKGLFHSALNLKFYCRDNLGNTALTVAMEEEAEAHFRQEESNKICIVLRCDPEGIKIFRRQLAEAIRVGKGTASLKMI
jgi:hypothetical protein